MKRSKVELAMDFTAIPPAPEVFYTGLTQSNKLSNYLDVHKRQRPRKMMNQSRMPSWGIVGIVVGVLVCCCCGVCLFFAMKKLIESKKH